MDVATVLFRCCKVDPDVSCVTMTSHVCCKFVFQMFHLFLNACFKYFPLDIVKLVLQVAKVHMLFKFPCACKTERAEPRAREETLQGTY
jgi:hypothetical protein